MSVDIPSMKLCLIAAADRKLGIGKNKTLPWKLKNEMAYFNKMTRQTSTPNKQNVVIMGRKTWESIPVKFRPLVHRLNIVLSKSLKESPAGALLFPTLDEAVSALENNYSNIDRVWIIGGFGVYREAINHPRCHRVYLTEVEGDFECDTFFPNIPEGFTRLTDHGDEKDCVPVEKQVEDGIEYYYRIYEKHNKDNQH